MTDIKATRRSFTVTPENRAGIRIIREHTGAATDQGAIFDAIGFRAAFANRTLNEVAQAIAFYDAIRETVNPGDCLALVGKHTPVDRSQIKAKLILVPGFT